MTLTRYLLDGTDGTDLTVGASGNVASTTGLKGYSLVKNGGVAQYSAGGIHGTCAHLQNVSGQVCTLRLPAAAASKTLAASAWVKSFPTVPAEFVMFHTDRNTSGTTLADAGSAAFRMYWGFAGGSQQLVINDTASGAQSILQAVANGTWYRIEERLVVDTATTGRYTIALYNAAGTQLGTTWTSTAFNLGTNPLVGGDWGILSTVTGVYDLYVDEVSFNDGSTAEIGAYVQGTNNPPTVTPPAPQNVAAGATVQLPFVETDDVGITSRTTTYDFPTTGGPQITGGTTTTPSIVAGQPGSLYQIRHRATDAAGLYDEAVAEVRVVQNGDIRPLAMAAVAGGWTPVGAPTGGGALADESDTTYIDSGVVAATEKVTRFRFQPSVDRTTGTVSFRADKYNPVDTTQAPGTGTLTARLFLAPSGGTALESWDVPATTSISTFTHDLLQATCTAITSAGAWDDSIYLELGAKS